MVVAICVCLSGCSMLPEISHQPSFHNPFPQLSKVAVAPFFNLSHEPTVDGRRVALAYFNELQQIPGFEVVPVGVTEAAMREHRITLTGPAEARKLAQVLDVDAVVIGAVTDYSAYYPPRMALQVEWYAANPGFHPIPPGYGLPWGTAEEKDIPGQLVFEAEMALAKAQMKTQTPAYEKMPVEAPRVERRSDEAEAKSPRGGSNHATPEVDGPKSPSEWGNSAVSPDIKPIQYTEETKKAGTAPQTGFPADWPDPKGFVPPPPSRQPPTCWPSDAPVIRHTRTYNGNDSDFTEALSSYYYFRNDARFGGWQSYLQRSDDFIRFCCRMHITETLSARGGVGETRVVWRWPKVR